MSRPELGPVEIVDELIVIDARLAENCGSSHWWLPVRCQMPATHSADYHAGWTAKAGTPDRKFVRYWAEAGVTEELVAGVWQPTHIPGPHVEDLLVDKGELPKPVPIVDAPASCPPPGWFPAPPKGPTPMTTTPTLAERLFATAAGSWGEEAAVWLLVEHEHWIEELDRLDLIRDDSTGPSFVRWAEFSDDLRPVGTDSEIQVLNVARALAMPSAVRPFRSLTSLDDTNRLLVLHAMAWAMGGHDYAKKTVGLPGLRCGSCGLRLTDADGKTAIAHLRSHKTAEETVR